MSQSHRPNVPTLWLLALLTGLGALAASAVPAQDLHPSRRPSPMAMARTTVGDTYIRVVYSRPYERGRDNIFGSEESEALVPFGKTWRTGANEATEITVTGDVTLGDQILPAGTYSLFTVPGPETWSIHFNSALGLSGTGLFDPVAQEFTPVELAETDVLVTQAKASTLAEDEKVEQFTISFEEATDGTVLVLRWITTEVRIPIGVAAD